MSDATIVHLLRHGEVHNPTGVLYGRLPGFRLSERGRAMAEMVASHLAGADGARRDLVHLVASPLQRAQETAAPVAAAFDLPIMTDERVVEAANHFEGLTVGRGEGSFLRPANLRRMWNPVRPSWGEPYREQVARMLAAIADARTAAAGHEALIVSHQLPIWITRSALEGRRLAHDPRRRECTLASLTSLHYRGETLERIVYSEPAAALLPGAATLPGA